MIIKRTVTVTASEAAEIVSIYVKNKTKSKVTGFKLDEKLRNLEIEFILEDSTLEDTKSTSGTDLPAPTKNV